MHFQKLERYLGIVASRLRQVRVGTALALTWSVAAVLCGVIWWNNLRQEAFRPLELVWLLGMTLVVAAFVLISAKRSARNLRTVALRVERAYPDLDAKLVTAIQQEPNAATGQYTYLQECVMKDALAHGYKHPWEKAVPTRHVILAHLGHLFGLCALIGMVSVTLFSKPNREVVDFNDVHEVPNEFTVSVEPGNTEVEKGKSLLVVARFDEAAPPKATLVYRDSSGKQRSVEMSRSLDDPVFGAHISNISKPVDYEIQFGDQSSDAFHVGVFEYPELLRADARLEYPSYMEKSPTIVEDVRRVSAIEGSQVELICQVNKPIKNGVLVDEDGKKIELAKDDEKSDEKRHIYKAKVAMNQPKRLKLHLLDSQERSNKQPPEFVINALPNQPAKIKLMGVRDAEVSPLEEHVVKARVWDDVGLKRFGISYNFGGDTPKDILLGEKSKAQENIEKEFLLDFESLKAEPDQLLSFHFWAEDVDKKGKTRRVTSNMYFAEVRPFEEIYRQGEQPPGGQQQQRQQQQGQQGQGNGRQAGQVADLQKQIISATWNMLTKTRLQGAPTTFVTDVETIADSQAEAQGKLSQLAQRIQDPKSQQHLEGARQAMTKSEEMLRKVAQDENGEGLADVLPVQQLAYQSLLRLRAREHQIVRQQQRQQQQSQSQRQQNQRRSQQMLNQLQLENRQNNYQNQRTQQQQEQKEDPKQREARQVLSRLRELARRQQDLNKQIKELELALNEAKTEQEKEELQRQLKRLREQQQEILRDTDKLKDRMERPDNQQEMADARQKLEQTRENVRRANEELDKGNLSQAAASGTRAEKQLKELKDDFRNRVAGEFNDRMRELRNEAQEIDERQKEIAKNLENIEKKKGDTLRGGNERQKVQDGLAQQKGAVENLLKEMEKTVLDAEQSEPLLTKHLYDTIRKARQSDLKDALEAADQRVQRGFIQEAFEPESVARKNIKELREGVEKAAESVLGDEVESLKRAKRELDRLANAVGQEIQRNDPQQNDQQRNGQQQEGQQRNGQQRNGQQQEGQQRNGQQRNGQQRNGQQQEGQQQEGQQQEGQQRNGQQRNGQQQEGQQRNGQQRNGQQQEGQQRSGQQRNGQRQEGQQQEGQQRNGQQRNGQQQEGQQRNGQQRNGQQQEGQQRNGQQRNGQQQEGQQRNGQQQEGQQRNGQQRGGLRQRRVADDRNGRRNPNGFSAGWAESLFRDRDDVAPLTGEDYRDWVDRLRDVEEMMIDPELRAEAARIRERARAMRADYKRHSKKPKWDLVRKKISQPLQELSSKVQREVMLRQNKEALVPLEREDVPSRFSEQVKRYYERLGAED